MQQQRAAAATRPVGFTLLAAATLVVAMTGSGAAGQPFGRTGRDTLRGLPGLEVIVETLQPEIEGRGLTRMSIQAEVERRLRASGITVYTSQAGNASPAKAYLYVHVSALERTGAGARDYAAAVQVQVRQTMRSVVTGLEVVDAVTWDAHNLITVPVLSGVGAEISIHVDRLIRDWMAVH